MNSIRKIVSFFIFSITAAILPGTSHASVQLAEATAKVYATDYDELRIFAPSCMISTLPETRTQLEWLAKKECHLRLKQNLYAALPSLMFYSDSTGLVSDTAIVYTKKPMSLREFLYRYLPEWEISGVDTSSVKLSAKWKKATVYAIASELASEYSVALDETTKSMNLTRKSTDSNSADVDTLRYGLVYEFSDLNLDLYELLRGYLSGVSVFQSQRDQKYYILLASSEKTRDPLTKSYAYIRASLDDRLTKSQQIGEYFPKEERENLQLLYILLSDAQIKNFNNSEMTPIAESELLHKGLKKYRAIVKKRIAEETFSLPEVKGAALYPVGAPVLPSQLPPPGASLPAPNSTPAPGMMPPNAPGANSAGAPSKAPSQPGQMPVLGPQVQSLPTAASSPTK